MNSKIVITKIFKPGVVNSGKGRYFEMNNRPSYAISLCVSGQITYEMNGKKFISKPDTAVILPKNGSYTLRGDQEGVFFVLNFECINFDCEEILTFPLINAEECIKDFFAIKNLYLFKDTRLKIYSIVYSLLDKVMSDDLPDDHFLTPATRYIEENFSDPKITNTVLANQLGISEVYLRKLFRKQFGVTPKQYILDIRIKKAKQLLVDSPFTVTAISEECGFSSLYHFCREFKEKTGVTPTEYSRKHRNYQI